MFLIQSDDEAELTHDEDGLRADSDMSDHYSIHDSVEQTSLGECMDFTAVMFL